MISVAPFCSVVSSIAQNVGDAEGRTGPRNPGAAVVKVPGLYGFAGMQIDREHGGQQAALAELGFDKGHGERMDRELGEQQAISPASA